MGIKSDPSSTRQRLMSLWRRQGNKAKNAEIMALYKEQHPNDTVTASAISMTKYDVFGPRSANNKSGVSLDHLESAKKLLATEGIEEKLEFLMQIEAEFGTLANAVAAINGYKELISTDNEPVTE